VSGAARVLVHADEACLGNGTLPPNPGGAGGLVEVRRGGTVVRRDYCTAEPDTTNNRMALRSAILALELLGAKGADVRVRIHSDSSYLVTGAREWMPAWKARGWKRKQGTKLVPPENLGLWQQLDALLHRPGLDVDWAWVRGHNDHPKNEYADFLATTAAKEQRTTDGLVESGFLAWLEAQRAKGKYLAYDPDLLRDG
jgi:ribonuclease HI